MARKQRSGGGWYELLGRTAKRNREIAQRVARGERQSVLAHEYGLTRQRISAIVAQEAAKAEAKRAAR